MAVALDPACPAAVQPTMRVEPETEEEIRERIDRYKILQKLGEGGCGVVYMAEQTEPVRRKVALKVIKLGMDTKQVIARFEAERQALALMDHPNIAKVLDAGTTEKGRPYFVMELVKGVRITDYCDQSHLPTSDRLALFTQVCQAVQHAHQKGIIHRDIKPSNILVTLHDGVPVPKVIDFGIAKATEQPLTEKTVFTAFGQFMGTPAYMSPEQAELSGLDIDTRSDIYALGVLLYELLTGKTPFDAKELLQAGLDEMRRRIREEEPMRPSTRLSTMADADLTTIAQQRQAEPAKLTRFIRGDLDWIVMKCLEKDRTRRYETANGLAADIRRHLNNEPVVACPPSAAYRFQKMVRRNKLAVGAVTGVAVALVTGLGIAAWQYFEKSHAFNLAIAAEQRAQESAAKEAAHRKQAEANEQKAKTEAAKSRQVSKVLKEMLGAAGPSVALGRDATVLREMLEKTSVRIGQELKDQPEVQGDIYSTIGSTFVDMGDHRRAITNLELAVSSYRLAFTNDHRNLADSLSALGFCQSFTMDVTNGNRNARLGLEMARRCGDQEILFRCLMNYACSFNAWGMGSTEAEPYEREALELKKRMGNDPVGLAEAKHLFASFSTNADEYVKLLREALEVFQRELPAGHPHTVQGEFSLGQALVSAGKFEEAEQTLKKALDGFHKTHAPDHPYQSIVLRFLIRVLVEQGKMREAETELREHVASFPSNINYYLMLARFRMQFGSLVGATEALPRDLQAKLEKGEFSVSWAVSLLHVGANEKFEEYRRKYLDVAFAQNDFKGKMDTAKVFLLHSGSAQEVERTCQFAGLVITNASDGDRYYYLEQLNALLDLRRGQFASAKRWASRHVAKNEEWKPRLSEGWFIRALACAQLQLPESAKSSFAKGNELLAKNLPDGTEAYLFMGDEWMLARYLAAEAQKAITAIPATVTEGPEVKDTDDLAFEVAMRADDLVRTRQWQAASVELLNSLKLQPTNSFLANALFKLAEDSLRQEEPPAVDSVHEEIVTRLFWAYSNSLPAVVACLNEEARMTRFSLLLLKRGHLAEVESLFKSKTLTLAQQSYIYGRAGPRKEAIANYLRSIELKPDDAPSYLELAPLLLFDGNVDGYRRLCEQIVQRFSGTKDLRSADMVAKACSLDPRAGVKLEPVAEAAETAVTLGKDSEYFHWFALCKSMVEYRQGHFAGAINWAQKELAAAQRPADCDAATYSVLAMAQKQTGQASAAQEALIAATKLIDGKLPKLDSDDLGHQWENVLIAHLLLREAQALIQPNAALGTNVLKVGQP